MALKLGGTDINKLYLGTTEINKAYLGDDVVFAGDAAIDISYVTNTSSGTNGSSFTFSSQPLKTASDQKIIIIYTAYGASTKTLSSVVVDGVTASIEVNNGAVGAGGNNFFVGIAVADGAISTTGSVVLTFSGTMRACSIGIYRMTGAASSTVSDSVTATLSGSTVSGSIDVPANGALLAVGYGFASSGTNSSWSATVSEDFDQLLSDEGSAINTSGAHLEYATLQSGITVSDTFGGTGLFEGRLAAASWGP